MRDWSLACMWCRTRNFHRRDSHCRFGTAVLSTGQADGWARQCRMLLSNLRLVHNLIPQWPLTLIEVMHLLGKWDYDTLTDVMALEPDFIPKPARTVALLFQQPSTRTHLSFLTAVNSLGYTPLDLGSSTSMEKGESLADTLAVIAAMGLTLQWCGRAKTWPTPCEDGQRRHAQ